MRGLLVQQPDYEIPTKESPRFRDFFAQARTKLTPEIADAFVLKRIGDGATIPRAKLEARALSSRPSLLAKLEAWSSTRIDALRQALAHPGNFVAHVGSGRIGIPRQREPD